MLFSTLEMSSIRQECVRVYWKLIDNIKQTAKATNTTTIKSGKAKRKTHNYESMQSAWVNRVIKKPSKRRSRRDIEEAEEVEEENLTHSCHCDFFRGGARARLLTLFQTLFWLA